MKTFFNVLSLMLITGCQNSKEPLRAPMERLQGHVTLVAGGADFVVTKPVYRRFQAPKNSFPDDVWKYLRSQPEHKDYSSLDNKGRAVWVDATGQVEEVEGLRDKQFVASVIHQMGPAHPRYLAWRRLFGAGVPDSVD